MKTCYTVLSICSPGLSAHWNSSPVPNFLLGFGVGPAWYGIKRERVLEVLWSLQGDRLLDMFRLINILHRISSSLRIPLQFYFHEHTEIHLQLKQQK